MKTKHTYAHHRRWLQQQFPGAVVGYRHDCYGCVLATYFNATAQIKKGCWVGERTWYDRHDRRHILPQWARPYRLGLDESGLDGITAAQALAILEEMA